MRRIANLMPPIVLRQVYFSLFQSVMDYGIVAWGDCGVTNRNRLIQVQNRVFRLMSELPASISQPLNFNKLYVLRVLCHGYIYRQ